MIISIGIIIFFIYFYLFIHYLQLGRHSSSLLFIFCFFKGLQTTEFDKHMLQLLPNSDCHAFTGTYVYVVRFRDLLSSEGQFWGVSL
jgi:hypothetical protein